MVTPGYLSRLALVACPEPRKSAQLGSSWLKSPSVVTVADETSSVKADAQAFVEAEWKKKKQPSNKTRVPVLGCTFSTPDSRILTNT